ncbi:major tail protein [Anaerorhabdus sp.]|uniref:major tail protein n=1 Tax=Anaerorhabdus sp. TaxID=1872524 RepID=UPI002FCB54A7
MAIVGIKHLQVARYEAKKYTLAMMLADLIDVDINIESNESKLYANDKIKEASTSFKGGQIKMTVDDLVDKGSQFILGQKTKEVTVGDKKLNVLVSNRNDKAPYVGIGFYSEVSRDNVTAYRAIVLLKNMFSIPKEKAKTREDKTEYQTKEVNATIFANDDGEWKLEVTVDTEEEAVAFVESILGTPGETVPANEGI